MVMSPCGCWEPNLGYHMHAGAHRGQKKAWDPLELELEAVVSHPLWMLGTDPWASVEQ